jgi:hypothetical protein
MATDKPVRRMTLRQLLTHSEKCTRDLIEQFQSVLLQRLTDFRDLSRPVRRRSHYPTMVAMRNALVKLQQTDEETMSLVDYLNEHLQAIREHASRERASRM